MKGGPLWRDNIPKVSLHRKAFPEGGVFSEGGLRRWVVKVGSFVSFAAATEAFELFEGGFGDPDLKQILFIIERTPPQNIN